ncbi:MAG TPA: galactitol-1-phosphate 5-dehydrogenase [Bacteroidales bacterium]|nr:galactitol-1-phosphate 5-dehydrogenase [Bacteroidales bacterium]
MMKALVLENYNQFLYKDVPDPEISADEVLIRVKACGICGSDVHGMDGSTGRRIPPLIMGHEASGVIEKAGKNVRSWNTGDRVTFDSTVYPLNDWFTLEGSYNLSDNREVIGVSPGNYRRNGAFAEFVAVPQHILYRIPDNVTFEQAAMVEPVAVALHAVNLSQLKLGESCVIIGAGTIGGFIVQLLRLAGVMQLIVVDMNEANLERARKLGADIMFHPSDGKIIDRVRQVTHSRGADLAFEAVGNSSTVNMSIDLVRKGGRVVLVGNLSPVIEFPLQKVVTQELKIYGSCAIRGEYATVLELMEKKKINTDQQISAVVPLSEGAMWFDRLRRNTEGLNKVILVP